VGQRSWAWLCALAVWPLASCGPQAAPNDPLSLGTASWPIIGGEPDSTDTNVFVLILSYYSSTTPGGTPIAQAFCSSTLIASQALVTAAHCTYPMPPIAPTGTQSMTIAAANVEEVTQGTGSFVASPLFTYDPGFDPNALTDDIGMVLLPQPPAARAKVWNTTDISGLNGAPIRVVGYGITSPTDTSLPERREVDLTLQNPTPTHFEVGNGTQGFCHGDSGGPSLYTFDDGIERIVGVHSYVNDQNCMTGEDSRIDAYQTFIQGWLAQNDPPNCGPDGYCVSGCTPVDPDCTPVGQACLTAAQCDGRQCVSDAQHPITYCSLTCTSSAACPSGMDCPAGVCVFEQLPTAMLGQPCTPGGTFCLNGDVCTGPVGGATQCLPPCQLTAQCSSGESCVQGSNSQTYCQPTPIDVDPVPSPLGAEASSCSAAGATPLVALSLLAWAAPRRRRAPSRAARA
jgi:hypothetical protein